MRSYTCDVCKTTVKGTYIHAAAPVSSIRHNSNGSMSSSMAPQAVPQAQVPQAVPRAAATAPSIGMSSTFMYMGAFHLWQQPH